MQTIQKHIILLVAILLWSGVSVFAGEAQVVHLSSGENAAMFVNAEFAGGTTNTSKFSLYVSPYLVANRGGRYTKHIYIGSQRIVSKLGDLKSYGADPRRIEYAGSESDGPKVDYKTKYALQQQVIKDNYAHFDVPYNGADNNNYVDGKGFSELDGSLEGAMMKAAMAHGGNKSAGLKDNFQQGDDYEQYQYFYHPDHLGSSSFITNTEGEVVQHIEYVPYGEVFIEERNNVWNTPYLFNAKEFDEETGLYYYGARYYDSRLAIWYGVDALAEEYPNMGGYVYCANNPIRLIDPDGNDWITAEYEGETFYYYDERVKSENDIISMYYYGDEDEARNYYNISYLGSEGELSWGDDEYKLNSDGTFSINGKLSDSEIDNNDLHIGSSLMMSKEFRNQTSQNDWYGNYAGANNPKLANGKDSYAIPPIDDLDYAGFVHDKAYDRVGAIGASDAFLNMRTIGADYELGIRSYKAYGNNATSYKNKGCVEIMIFSYTITGLKEMRR